MVANGAARWSGFRDRLGHHPLDGFHQGLVVAMLYHERSQLAVKFTEQQEVAVAHFVKDCNGVSLTVVGLALGLDGAHIGDVATVTNDHVIQIVADILDEAVIANGHIAQRGIVDAAVLHEAVGDLHCAAAVTQAGPAVELHTMAAAGVKVGRHHDIIPVLRPAVFFLQGFDLLVSEMEVFFHIFFSVLDLNCGVLIFYERQR